MVEQITSGTGIRMPPLILETADRRLLAIKLGAERILLASDPGLQTGGSGTMRYALTLRDELVAIAIAHQGRLDG